MLYHGNFVCLLINRSKSQELDVKINLFTTYRNLESCPESDRPEVIQEIGAKYFKVLGEGLELENTQVNTYIKRNVSRDILLQVFFMNHLLPQGPENLVALPLEAKTIIEFIF